MSFLIDRLISSDFSDFAKETLIDQCVVQVISGVLSRELKRQLFDRQFRMQKRQFQYYRDKFIKDRYAAGGHSSFHTSSSSWLPSSLSPSPMKQSKKDTSHDSKHMSMMDTSLAMMDANDVARRCAEDEQHIHYLIGLKQSMTKQKQLIKRVDQMVYLMTALGYLSVFSMLMGPHAGLGHLLLNTNNSLSFLAFWRSEENRVRPRSAMPSGPPARKGTDHQIAAGFGGTSIRGGPPPPRRRGGSSLWLRVLLLLISEYVLDTLEMWFKYISHSMYHFMMRQSIQDVTQQRLRAKVLSDWLHQMVAQLPHDKEHVDHIKALLSEPLSIQQHRFRVRDRLIRVQTLLNEGDFEALLGFLQSLPKGPPSQGNDPLPLPRRRGRPHSWSLTIIAFVWRLLKFPLRYLIFLTISLLRQRAMRRRPTPPPSSS